MAEWNTSAWAFAHRVPYKGGGFTVGSSEPTGFPTLEGALDSVAELAEELDAEANRTRHGFIELHLAVVRKTMSERSLELVIDQQDAAGAVEAAEQFCKAAELLFGPDEEERLEYERKIAGQRSKHRIISEFGKLAPGGMRANLMKFAGNAMHRR